MKKAFFKFNLVATVLFLCYSCQTSTTNTENTTDKDSVATQTTSTQTVTPNNPNQETTIRVYRSDGHQPNITSEWVSVKIDSEDQKILEIAYWNTNEEKKVLFEIVSQDFKQGDFSGYIGKLRSNNDTTTKTFGLVDEHFNIGFGEEGQEFVEQKTIK